MPSKNRKQKIESMAGGLALRYALGKWTKNYTAFNDYVKQIKADEDYKKFTTEDHKALQSAFNKAVGVK